MNHSPGPWRWDDDRRELLSENPRAGEPINAGYPPFTEPRETRVLWMCEDGGDEPDEADAKLISLAPTMRERLLALEWSAKDEAEDPGYCPECGQYKETLLRMPANHVPDCSLGKLLEQLR